jgi:hypothetical protein
MLDSMERIIKAKVLSLKRPPGKTPQEHAETTVVLQCPPGEVVDKTAKVSVPKAIFKEQDTTVAANDRIEVRGIGKPIVKEGDLVEVRIIKK